MVQQRTSPTAADCCNSTRSSPDPDPDPDPDPRDGGNVYISPSVDLIIATDKIFLQPSLKHIHGSNLHVLLCQHGLIVGF
jgi:hypothetical protein